VAHHEECGCQHIVGEVRNRSAGARPPPFKQGTIHGRGSSVACFSPSLGRLLTPNLLGSKPLPDQVRVPNSLHHHSFHPDPNQDGSERASAERQGRHVGRGRSGPFAQGIMGRILGEGEEDQAAAPRLGNPVQRSRELPPYRGERV
jgi:hypothetical protein